MFCLCVWVDVHVPKIPTLCAGIQNPTSGLFGCLKVTVSWGNGDLYCKHNIENICVFWSSIFQTNGFTSVLFEWKFVKKKKIHSEQNTDIFKVLNISKNEVLLTSNFSKKWSYNFCKISLCTIWSNLNTTFFFSKKFPGGLLN